MLDAGHAVRVFNFADAVISVTAGQQVPHGFYNLAKMTTALTAKGGRIGNCGACMDARGMSEGQLIDGAHRSSMAELAEWTTWADQVVNV
ncbi:DsrE/DsrF/TusD sulfur relay family protein [Nocardia otitidiscaviarum]|nr:DsrE family protein [Nocardia otitidiscaviarum]